MKNKLVSIVSKTKNNVKKMGPSLLSTVIMGFAVLNQTAFAATDTTLFTTIVKALGGVSIAGAAIWAIMGFIAYGEAKTDGEGPEMKKAKNQITGAIILAVVGLALSAGASTIAGTIKDITF